MTLARLDEEKAGALQRMAAQARAEAPARQAEESQDEVSGADDAPV
jgi:hypothetical protein